MPSNNPFATAEGWQKYVWAYGLRDPAKFTVQSQNGIVFINDPGETSAEEINVGVAGGNYGWPTVEGGSQTPVGSNPIGPVHTIPHAPTDPEAIAGGHIAGGVLFNPGSLTFPMPYAGDYFFADRDKNIIQVMGIEKLAPTGVVSPFATDVIRPVDIAYTIPGDLFVIAQGVGDAGGQLIRYRATGSPSIVNQPAGVRCRRGSRSSSASAPAGLPR